MNKTYKKLLGLNFLLLLSSSINANFLTNTAANMITKMSGDKYTINDIQSRLTEVITIYLEDTTRKPSVTIDDLADEFEQNGWPTLKLWILEFSDTLLKRDPATLTEQEIATIGKKAAMKHLSYKKLIQLSKMLADLDKTFKNNPKVKSVDWYEVLKHRRHLVDENDKSSMIDVDVIEITVNEEGNETMTKIIDHYEFDKKGDKIKHDHEKIITEIELAKK